MKREVVQEPKLPNKGLGRIRTERTENFSDGTPAYTGRNLDLPVVSQGTSSKEARKHTLHASALYRRVAKQAPQDN